MAGVEEWGVVHYKLARREPIPASAQQGGAKNE